jgi:hypothetical protein
MTLRPLTPTLVPALAATLLSACGAGSGGGAGAELPPLPQADAADDVEAPADTAPEGAPEVVAARACGPGDTTRCLSERDLDSCVDGAWQTAACPGLTFCESGACLPRVCDPQATPVCADATSRSVCEPPGTRLSTLPCPAGPCVDGACTEGCEPGARWCEDGRVMACGDDFAVAVAETCDSDEACVNGRCLDACGLLSVKRSYLGCSFLAADLPNDPSAIDNLFAFTFSNASSERTARVTIESPWGDEATVTVPPGGLAIHPLPVPRLFSQIATPGRQARGFFIRSDAPVAAVMFNPLERYDAASQAKVATNDASLLIPEAALGLDHVAVTWSDPGQYSEPPFVVVVAQRDGTRVRVTSRETIVLPGPPWAIPRDTPTEVELARGEVLNLEPPKLPNVRTDLTGTRVTSLNHPIAVFSGNRCARVPDAGRFCDHLETQVPPVESLGTRHVLAKFADRGGESDYVRIVALTDGTTLAFDPPLPAASAPMRAGEVRTVELQADVALTTSSPVLVAQFMASQSMTDPDGPFGQSDGCPAEIGGSCVGDPSLVLAAPVGKWQFDLIFLVPETYRWQFANVVLEAGSTLSLDGAPVDTSSARTIGASGFLALTLPLTPGRYRLTGSRPISAIIYGYDHNISYAYCAGLAF